MVNCIKYLEPSFGAINLEDIKSPDCFFVERQLKELMNIPVFHDDQHGAAIVILAGLLNALHIVDKKLDEIKVVVCIGAGSRGIGTCKLLKQAGVIHENITMWDKNGVV